VLEGSALAFGFAAGLSLWSVQANAVKTFKIFLIYNPMVALASILCQFIIRTSNMDVSAMVASSTTHIIGSIGYSVVYYWYLMKSKRVAHTYGGGQHLVNLQVLTWAIIIPLAVPSALAMKTSFESGSGLNGGQPAIGAIAQPKVSAPSFEEQLNDTCNQQNAICPIKVDDSTQIVAVRHSGPREIEYTMKFSTPILKTQRRLFIEVYRKMVINNFLGNSAIEPLRKGGVILGYVLLDHGGVEFGRFKLVPGQSAYTAP
jgi:hypothetical protein